MLLEENLRTIRSAQLDIELLKRQNEKMCEDNNAKISEFQNTIKLNEEKLEEELKESGEKKIECKIGYASYREMPDKWIYGENTIDEIYKLYPKEAKKYIKITEILIKANVKIDCENGKIGLPSVTKESQLPKFNYKIKGGK